MENSMIWKVHILARPGLRLGRQRYDSDVATLQPILFNSEASIPRIVVVKCHKITYSFK